MDPDSSVQIARYGTTCFVGTLGENVPRCHLKNTPPGGAADLTGVLAVTVTSKDGYGYRNGSGRY